MSRPQQPTVEDYHSSEDSDSGSPIRRASPSAAQANVSSKRSGQMGQYPADRSPPAEKVVPSDHLSDSGYSSHTAATMSSADSGPSAKMPSLSPPTPPESAASAPAASPAERRRPALDRDDRQSSHGSRTSTVKPLGRTGSVSTRPRPSKDRRSIVTENIQDCTDPNCTKCDPPRGRRPPPTHRDSGLDMTTRSEPISTVSYTSPPSPMYPRPSEYRQAGALVQPAHTARPRRPSSVNQAARHSFAGDMSHGFHWAAGMPAHPGYPQQHAEAHGPPISYHNSAYAAQMAAAYPMMGATPSNYFAPQMQQGQYDMQRPALMHQSSSNYSARTGRPVSQYGPTVVTQEHRELPSARFHSKPPPSATQATFSKSQFEDDSDSDSESEVEESSQRRAIMAPPPKPTRRGSIRQTGSYTSERSERSERRKSLLSQTVTQEPPRDRERDRTSRLSVEASSRRASVSQSRPALKIVQPARKQVIVEDPRSSQVQSYRQEKPYAPEPDRRSKTYHEGTVPLSKHRRNRTDVDIQQYSKRDRRSQMFDDEDDEAIQPRPRRQTEADLARELRATTDDVEAYITGTRGSNVPLNDHVHNAALRSSRLPSGRSDSGSSRSKGSGKESRITSTTNGEIRLKIDASKPMSLQFNGDMEGRQIRLEPAEDGMANVVITNTEYHGSSDRTLVSHRSSGHRRRDPDEVSSRTSRSSQARREAERRRDMMIHQYDRRYEEETLPLRRRKDYTK